MRDPRIITAVIVALAALTAPTPAGAAAVFATSYSTPNGDGQASGGTYNYWDRNYTGAGATTVDGAPLTGGLGKLTDGVISTQVWSAVSNVAGTGEYVGWVQRHTPNPVVTFNFVLGTTITEIDVFLDNSQTGGVFAPSSVLIDGISRSFTPPAPGSVGKVAFTGLALTSTVHTIEFDQTPGNWVFVSEVTFGNGIAAVPEPATWGLLAVGLAAALARRRVGRYRLSARPAARRRGGSRRAATRALRARRRTSCRTLRSRRNSRTRRAWPASARRDARRRRRARTMRPTARPSPRGEPASHPG